MYTCFPRVRCTSRSHGPAGAATGPCNAYERLTEAPAWPKRSGGATRAGKPETDSSSGDCSRAQVQFMTTITAIVWADSMVPEDERAEFAEEKAANFPNQLFEDYVWNTECEEIVPWGSSRAEELVENALSKTKQLLESDMQTIEAAITSDASLREVLADSDFRRSCRNVSDVQQGRYGLYDASDYAFGTPVFDQDRLEEILDHHEDGLFVARISYDR